MKWWKKKGVWFSLGFELLGALVCLAGGVALLFGYIIHVIVAVVVLGIIAIFASGGDISI
jgi:hypothetical protein